QAEDGIRDPLVTGVQTCALPISLTELSAALRGESAAIVLAAERRIAKPASPQEMTFGDGAAGALLGRGAPIATYVASRSTHADQIGRASCRERGCSEDGARSVKP